MPYQPMTGERARSNDPASFCSFGQAVNAKGYDGLGVGIFDGLCAIDIDHCVDEFGELSDVAEEIVNGMHSYTELSPSGEGVHILFEVKNFQYNKDAYYVMNHAVGLEVYVAGATSKYVTVTGKQIHSEYEFGERGSELSTILDRFMKRNPCKLETQNFAINAIKSPEPQISEAEVLKLAAIQEWNSVQCPVERLYW